jgi:hypothetical protein
VVTANVGSRAPACLTFYMVLREGGPLPQTAGAPIRARLGSGNRSGDRSRDIFTVAVDQQLHELNSRFNEQATELLILCTTLDPKDSFK